MNKKGQTIDPNNPLTWVGGIIMFFVAIMIIGVLFQALRDINCSSQNAEIERLKGDLATCQTTIVNLNQSLSGYDERLQQIQDSCNDQISNATEQCQGDLNFYIELFSSYKFVFVIYNVIFIFWITLSFSLFDSLFGLNISFGKRVDSYLDKHKKAWTIFKWVVWSIMLLLVLSAFLTLLTIKP